MLSFHFWSLALFMVLAATAILVVPLYWRESRLPFSNAWQRWEPLVMVAAVPLLALTLYYYLGSPALAAASPAPLASIADAHTAAARGGNRDGGNRDGGDLDQAIAKLRARLDANPGDAAGWNLLAQSYEFQGNTVAAADARARASATGSTAPVASMTDSAPAVAAAAVARTGADITALIQRAQDARRARNFTAAVAAFTQLEQRGALDADLWADYADSVGGAHGKLDADAARCIDAALRLDPQHIKALWLRASLQTQQRDHRAALATWQQLAKLLPADSPDARIIAANLAEARANLGSAGGAPAPVTIADTSGGDAGPVLHGNVRLDPRWKTRVAAGSVLFIYARAADERGPPLAVWRTSTGAWPVRFSLGDADAMMPGRRLSDFRRVVLEARVSRSGNAIAQPGDLRAVSAVLDPRTAPEQQLVIAEEVGASAQGG